MVVHIVQIEKYSKDLMIWLQPIQKFLKNHRDVILKTLPLETEKNLNGFVQWATHMLVHFSIGRRVKDD